MIVRCAWCGVVIGVNSAEGTEAPRRICPTCEKTWDRQRREANGDPLPALERTLAQ